MPVPCLSKMQDLHHKRNRSCRRNNAGAPDPAGGARHGVTANSQGFPLNSCSILLGKAPMSNRQLNYAVVSRRAADCSVFSTTGHRELFEFGD